MGRVLVVEIEVDPHHPDATALGADDVARDDDASVGGLDAGARGRGRRRGVALRVGAKLHDGRVRVAHPDAGVPEARDAAEVRHVGLDGLFVTEEDGGGLEFREERDDLVGRVDLRRDEAIPLLVRDRDRREDDGARHDGEHAQDELGRERNPPSGSVCVRHPRHLTASSF